MASRFEYLRMMEYEIISNFNSTLCDNTNKAFSLGEKYSNTKLMRKTQRSLSKRFAYKVIAIEKARDVNTMKHDELISSL